MVPQGCVASWNSTGFVRLVQSPAKLINVHYFFLVSLMFKMCNPYLRHLTFDKSIISVRSCYISSNVNQLWPVFEGRRGKSFIGIEFVYQIMYLLKYMIQWFLVYLELCNNYHNQLESG